MYEVFLSDKNYEFGIERGIGINDTPWECMRVRTKKDSNADKYVVRVELQTDMPDFNGEPVKYKVYSVEVNFHGYSNRSGQTVTEYIQTLNEAINFAEKVSNWMRNMGLEVPFTNK